MKRCPVCQRTYTDETLKFCRVDGRTLVDLSPFPSDSDKTLDLSVAEPTVDLSVSQPGAQTSRVTSNTHPSIAVLPFVHMSADPDSDYFCDGLAEELLNALAKVEGLKVAARTSAFFFKGKDSKIDEIGEALNVSTVLEGSVRKSGSRLRITAQLINVSDGYHLWSERYDRQMEDVFDIQDEITLAIVDALKVKLLGREKTAVFKRYTDNIEAYESYLKGRYYFNKFSVENWKRAIEYFEEAIRAEPDYALAYAGIAHCWKAFWYHGLLPPQETISKWKESAMRALELDSTLAEAHLPLANLQFLFEWDWDAAETGFKRAIELNPNSAEARVSYAVFLGSRGRYDQAIIEGERSLELDPLSLLINNQVAGIYWLANRFDEAIEQARNITEIEPNYFGAYWMMGGVYLSKGCYEESIEAYEKAVAMGGTNMVISTLGRAYGVAGKREEALAILNQLLEIREREYLPAFYIARVYMGLGENDSAFEWLEKACEERNGEMVFLNGMTKVGTGNLAEESITKDPRFSDLLRRAGLAR